jgi:hypothetical protein
LAAQAEEQLRDAAVAREEDAAAAARMHSENRRMAEQIRHLCLQRVRDIEARPPPAAAAAAAAGSRRSSGGAEEGSTPADPAAPAGEAAAQLSAAGLAQHAASSAAAPRATPAAAEPAQPGQADAVPSAGGAAPASIPSSPLPAAAADPTAGQKDTSMLVRRPRSLPGAAARAHRGPRAHTPRPAQAGPRLCPRAEKQRGRLGRTDWGAEEG